MRQAIAPDPRP